MRPLGTLFHTSSVEGAATLGTLFHTSSVEGAATGRGAAASCDLSKAASTGGAQADHALLPCSTECLSNLVPLRQRVASR